jgi:hypothetical protein
MFELLSSALWPRVRKIAKSAKKKQAAVAYVTDDRFIKFGQGDSLVTDASEASIKAGQTCAKLLKRAFERGATIHSIDGLHAKLYVFDRMAVIGSSNLSKGSESLVEAAMLTDQPSAVSSVRLLIASLQSQGELVDEAFVKRICKLKVVKSKRRTTGARRKSPSPKEPRTWLIGLSPTEEKESEREAVEKGQAEAERRVSDEGNSVSWIRLRGRSKMRNEVKEGDLIVSIWSENPKRNPTAVYSHAPVLNRVDDKTTGSTILYLEDYPDAEENCIAWQQFKKLYKQVGIGNEPAKTPTREVKRQQSDALHELWHG